MGRKTGNRTPIVLLVTAVVLVGTIAGVALWRSRTIARQSENRRVRTERLIREGKAPEALEVIAIEERVTGPQDGNDPQTVVWRRLKRQALTKIGNAAGLEELFDKYPAEVENDEPASLLLYRAKSVARRKEDRKIAVRLAKRWEPSTDHPEWWLSARADSLLACGERAAAEKLLRSRSFPGVADTNRLLRLAMLFAPRDPQRAWSHVQRAYSLAPRNPEVRSFRARLLETAGQVPQARVEYAAAWLAAPQNAMWCDQLAEFYRRHGDLNAAVRTWTDGLSSGADADFLRVKALFWSRVAEPIAFPAMTGDRMTRIPPGPLQPFARYLQNVPTDAFWDPDRFDELTSARRLERDRQEAFWLTVLHALSEGKEKRAHSLIAHNPFRDETWNPFLERALDLILTYRLTGKLESNAGTAPRGNAAEQHTFLGELERYASGAEVPETVAVFLRSDHAIPGALLASGWTEAAIRCHRATNATGLPGWYVYGMTQALRHNRGSAEALSFAMTRRGPDPALEILVAELRLALGESESAMALLARHAAMPGDVGYRAAWMLASEYLDRNQPEEAVRITDAQPELAKSDTGVALKARAALARGQLENARSLYRSILEKSGEAKMFVAKMAYDRGDYAEAERLTEELLRLYPDTLAFRANLRRIRERAQEATRRGGQG